MPELLRRADVMKLTGWSKFTYYEATRGLRVRVYGYHKELRVPKGILVGILQNDLLTS